MDEISYSLGVVIGTNFKRQGFENIDVASLSKALDDVLNGTNELEIDSKKADDIITAFFENVSIAKAENNYKIGLNYLSENRKNLDVVELDSGLQYKIVVEGNGDIPSIDDIVITNYTGMFLNGDIFDSSKKPIDFPVKAVIPGWVEALTKMPVGSTWRIFVPSKLAYGEAGAGDTIPSNSTLIFDIELLEIKK